MRLPALCIYSTASYSDAWPILIDSLVKYLPFFENYQVYIVSDLLSDEINSEFNFPDNVSLLQYDVDSMDWGGRILKSFEDIDNDEILFLLEDYILTSKVNEEMLKNAFKLLRKDGVANVCLGNHDLSRSFEASNLDDFVKLRKRSNYKITSAPGLWKVQYLKQYLSNGLNPWQFEIVATRKSWFKNHEFYSVNIRLHNLKNEVFPYFISSKGLDSAIVRGKWQEEILEHVDPRHEPNIRNRGFLPGDFQISGSSMLLLLRNPLALLKLITK